MTRWTLFGPPAVRGHDRRTCCLGDGHPPLKTSVVETDSSEAANTSGAERTGFRVLVLVFDELDFTTAFSNGPDLHLPEFDRLQRESFWAEHAYPPSDLTLQSMPSYLSGREVVGARIDGAELMLRFKGQEGEHPRSQEPSLFTRARRTGVRSALVGWYHPYCRVLAGQTAECHWYAHVPTPGAATKCHACQRRLAGRPDSPRGSGDHASRAVTKDRFGQRVEAGGISRVVACAAVHRGGS